MPAKLVAISQKLRSPAALENLRNASLVVGTTVFSAGAAFAQATTPEASMGQAETTILALIAVAGAAMIAVSLAGVGWSVGAKLIKRIGGKA